MEPWDLHRISEWHQNPICFITWCTNNFKTGTEIKRLNFLYIYNTLMILSNHHICIAIFDWLLVNTRKVETARSPGLRVPVSWSAVDCSAPRMQQLMPRAGEEWLMDDGPWALNQLLPTICIDYAGWFVQIKCIEKSWEGANCKRSDHKAIVTRFNRCHCSVPCHVPSPLRVACDKMHCVCNLFWSGINSS